MNQLHIDRGSLSAAMPVLMVAFSGKLLPINYPTGLVAVGAVAFAAALVTAHIAHVLIERPVRNFIVGIGKRRLPAIA